MTRIDFSSLPDDARVWVFAADRAVAGDAERALLDETDDFLGRWQAHGEPLRCARDWRDAHFLVIGVDQTPAHASGCSVDGLFRVFQRLEPRIGARLLGGGRVFYRAADGSIAAATRDELRSRAAAGEITGDTPVFDTSVTSLSDYRDRFERPARETWVARLLP